MNKANNGFSLIIGGGNDYGENVEKTRQDVLEFLRRQKSFLSLLLETPDFLKSEKTDNLKRHLNKDSIELWFETLQDEIYKVDRLEITLAVVGTMKAGKSTTINAIVGTEVLPNRNQPMTTLPTIIRHVPGQKTPILTFPKPEPFNNVISLLKKELQHKFVWGDLDKLPLCASEDGKQLVQDILSETLTEIKDNYNSPEEIFDFLKATNDLARLCECLDIPSPLIEYDNINEFPTIDVEFHHLSSNFNINNKGKFALIDTPGPNEAGQKYLKQILREQLEKASAVLTVLDYTQLNSEAEADIRKTLEEISCYSEDQMFVLVNKYDQKDRHGMDREEIRKYVATELFNDKVDIERIFPVSSRYGYLANRALNEMSLNGRLPDANNESWVEDFGELALGRIWAQKINNFEEVRNSANELWKSSYFEKLLYEVILKTYSDAAAISLASAVDKMVSYNTQIVSSLDLRTSAINADIKEIREHIESFEEHIEKIKDIKDETFNFSNKEIDELHKQVKELFYVSNKALKEVIEEWIREESFSDILSLREKYFNAYSTSQEAEKYLEELYATIEEKLEPILSDLQYMVDKRVSEIEDNLWKDVYDKLKLVLEAAQERLNETFTVTLTLPKPKLNYIGIDLESIHMSAINQDTVVAHETKYEKKWYTLWLHNHEVEYTVEDTVFKVNTVEVGKRVLNDLNKYQESLGGQLNRYVNDELKKTIDDYFEQVFAYLERFRGDLLDSKSDKQLEEDKLEKLQSNMNKLHDLANEFNDNISPIKDIVESLKSNINYSLEGSEGQQTQVRSS